MRTLIKILFTWALLTAIIISAGNYYYHKGHDDRVIQCHRGHYGAD